MKIKKNGHRVVKASLGSAVLLSLLLGGQVFAADPIVINSDNGTANTVSGADNSTVIGNENTVTNSKSQVVIGDKNVVQDRNKGTVSGKQETRTDTVMDILIGKGNNISGNDTYMKGNEALTIIGNNNRLGNPTSAIIIGDNQYIMGTKSIVIGSLAEPYTGEAAGGGNVILGYDTLSEGGGSVLLGNVSYVGGMFQTVSGFNSRIETGNRRMSGGFATIYGAFNRSRYGFDDSTDNSGIDGTASSIIGTFNDTKNARGTLILGAGNGVTNSIGAGDANALTTMAMDLAMNASNMSEGKALDYDTLRNSTLDLFKYTGGSTVVFGNVNQSDYSNLSQIIGTGNILKGSTDSISSYNMVSGYENTGTNINRTSIVGTGNTITNSEDNIILGDYHEMSGGNHNVILGSRDYTETTETITYTPPYYPFGATYEVTKRTANSKHADNIQNAVMLGYNTDVTQNGGVALGAQSVASTAAGIAGFDPSTGKASEDTSSTWKSTLAAVSVGYDAVKDADGNITTAEGTRQITHVAAGTADTDAVNVAQLREVAANAADGNDTLKETNSALSIDGNILKLAIEDTAGHKVTGSVELNTIASKVDTKNTIAKGSHIDYTTKANEYGGTEYTLSVVTDGKVESGNTGIVTGGTVYNETRVAKDGTYVKQSKSAGENLTALDSQVAANTTQITQNTNNITSISNEVSNITNNVTSLNSQVNKLDNRINRVGAGAAALAALHPQDYDPTAKWDFAAGYGNYKSANAVAIGAFYRPTNDLLFSVGTSMGGGENMFNAGVSIKFGKGSEYSNYSKTDLVSVISSQQAEISAVKADNEAIKADNEAKTKRIEALEKQMQEILSQINR